MFPMLPIVQFVWPSYKGLSAILLSLILFLIGAGLFLSARRMKREIKLPRMGKIVGGTILVIWAFSIIFFLRVNQILAQSLGGGQSLGPIFPITILSAVATFCYVAYVTRRGGLLPSLCNGFLAAIAGPMVFELPDVLIIIPLIKASLVAEIAYLVPLFTIVLTTLSLLLLSRKISLTKNSVYLFSAMLFVFSLWALDGYAYPTNPITFTLNAVSKILGFACIAAMFQKSPLASTSATEKSDDSSTPVNHGELIPFS
jgi:hypothetical protein